MLIREFNYNIFYNASIYNISIIFYIMWLFIIFSIMCVVQQRSTKYHNKIKTHENSPLKDATGEKWQQTA
jgi:hypothetical protein